MLKVDENLGGPKRYSIITETGDGSRQVYIYDLAKKRLCSTIILNNNQ